MIAQDSVVIRHGFLYHTGAEFHGKHCWSYHIYLIPRDVEGLDCIASSYKAVIYINADEEEKNAVQGKQEVVAPLNCPHTFEIHADSIPHDYKLAACG